MALNNIHPSNNIHLPLMKRSSLLSLVAGAAVLLSPAASTAFAQDTAPATPPAGGQGGNGGGQGGPGGGRRGGFDPAQMRQRMMERYREQLGVKDDAEWGVIEGRITKIDELRRASMMRGFGGFGGRGPGGPGGGPGGNQGQGNRGGGPFGQQPNPDAEALQAALDGGASSDEIKAKLAAYRDSLKKKEAELTKAQDDLRALLSVKQEASAVLLGLLK